MPHPITRPEILAALESNAEAIAAFFPTVSEPAFWAGDPDHWGPAHHVVHLTQASVSVERALRSRKLPLHPTGRSRTYAEIRDAATNSLAATPKGRLLDMGRRVVIAPGVDRAEIVSAFTTASAKLREAAAGWTEDDLDRYALVHPLIGEMTVREMLLFFVVHERHHLKSVRTKLEG